jgi:hypothetical protein
MSGPVSLTATISLSTSLMVGITDTDCPF